MLVLVRVESLGIYPAAMSVLINHQVFGAPLGALCHDVCTLQVQGLTRFCLQLSTVALLDEQSKEIKSCFDQEKNKVKLNFLFL